MTDPRHEQDADELRVQAAKAAAPEPSAPPEPEAAESGEPGDAAEAAADGDAAAAAEDPVVRAERERDEYLDALRRERAEFENFRKRSTKERMDAVDRGAEQLVANLLGVLDTFGFAMDAAGKSEDEQLAKGVRMVHDELVNVLVAAGLTEVPGEGAVFDPTVHEAMLQVEAADVLGEPVDEPVVVEVLRRGWRFKSRVLRPASVKVAR